MNAPITETHADEIVTAVVAITQRCHNVLAARAEFAARAAEQRTVCAADGCLVFADETCPACAVRARAREEGSAA